MTVSQQRVADLIRFAREHESEPTRGCDLVAAKSALLARLLGPGADADVVGPMTEPGRVNGLVEHEGRSLPSSVTRRSSTRSPRRPRASSGSLPAWPWATG